eukprot:gb/GECH01012057.1/.p1 GENE.gb/GECH01012057.1/~~gb/GECH01012057.1/.p1  ORF type:complete len:483 (+),score=141.56 gb/GECH01012057.1/:1-1449(+)
MAERPEIPEEFTANVTFKMGSFFPEQKGKMAFSYPQKAYRIDTYVPMAGNRQIWINRHDKGVRYAVTGKQTTNKGGKVDMGGMMSGMGNAFQNFSSGFGEGSGDDGFGGGMDMGGMDMGFGGGGGMGGDMGGMMGGGGSGGGMGGMMSGMMGGMMGGGGQQTSEEAGGGEQTTSTSGGEYPDKFHTEGEDCGCDEWECEAEYLGDEIYPMSLPPTAEHDGTEEIRGIECDVWKMDFGFEPMKMNLTWYTDTPNNAIVRFTVRNAQFGDFMNATWDFEDFSEGLPEIDDVFEPPCECPEPLLTSSLDIIMLLDGSGSIQGEDWEKAKEFSLKVLNKMKFQENKGPRYGIIQFSSDASVSSSLGGDYESHKDSIEGLDQFQSSTNTAGGLEQALTEFGENGRNATPRVVFVVTDGNSNDSNATAEAAEQLRGESCEIFSIGVGDGIDLSELESIASEPNDKHVFSVEDWDALQGILDDLFLRCA